MLVYKGKIKNIKPNQIFVFGSNNQGRHGKGSALFARLRCGAIYGQASGLQGNSYAIITKDLTKKIHPSISKDFIIKQIKELYEYAESENGLKFLFIVAYSGTGDNLNNYSCQEMADMFSTFSIPKNMIFEYDFYKLMNHKQQLT
jgi:hypothetical protein